MINFIPPECLSQQMLVSFSIEVISRLATFSRQTKLQKAFVSICYMNYRLQLDSFHRHSNTQFQLV